MMYLVCLMSSQSLTILISKFFSMMFPVCLLSSQSFIILRYEFYSLYIRLSNVCSVCLISWQSLIILISEFYSVYDVSCVPHVITIIDSVTSPGTGHTLALAVPTMLDKLIKLLLYSRWKNKYCTSNEKNICNNYILVLWYRFFR